MLKTLVALSLGILSMRARAQNEQPFLNKRFSLEMAVAGAMIAADGYTTHRIQAAYGNRFIEMNPIARPFTANVTGYAAYFGGSYAALLLGNKLLIKHPHYRHILNWSVIATEGYWTAHNIRVEMRSK